MARHSSSGDGTSRRRKPAPHTARLPNTAERRPGVDGVVTVQLGHLPATTAPPHLPAPGEPTEAAPGEPAGGFGPVLRNPAFVRLWSAQLLSQMAQNTIWVVLIARIASLTGSTTHVGLAIISGIAPQMLLSGFAGVIVDRESKRAVLFVSNVLRIGIVAAYMACRDSPALMYLLTFVSQGVSQFFGPAEAASIPILVGPRHLMAATSLFNLTFNAAQFIPFGVGLLIEGWLQGAFGGPTAPDAGFEAVMIGAGVFYVAAAALVRTLPSSTAERQPRGASGSLGEAAGHIWRDLEEGIRFISQDRRLGLALIQINIAPTFFFVFGELALIYVQRVIRLPTSQTYLVLLPAGVGLVVGLLALGRYGYRVRKDLLISTGLIAMGVAVMLMGLLRPIVSQFVHISAVLGRHQPITSMVPPSMAVAVVMGMAMALTTVPTQTVVLERATPEVRGRVLAMQQVIGGAIPIIPLIVVGPLADAFGVANVLTGIGAVILLSGVLSALFTHHTEPQTAGSSPANS
jgi:MFS family permease